MNLTRETLDQVFSYHAPFGSQPTRYERIRAAAKAYAEVILECCPASREASVALTELQGSVMWANASIALNETAIEKQT